MLTFITVYIVCVIINFLSCKHFFMNNCDLRNRYDRETAVGLTLVCMLSGLMGTIIVFLAAIGIFVFEKINAIYKKGNYDHHG